MASPAVGAPPLAPPGGGGPAGAPPPPANSVAASPAQPVRLPPVSLPSTGFLDAPGSFNPAARRQSINSDPFLHAFSAPSDGQGNPVSDHHQQHHFPPPAPAPLQRSTTDDASAASLQHGGMHGSHTPVPAEHPHGSGMAPPDGYHQQYSNSYSAQSQAPQYGAAPAGPAPSYRFGGPAPPSGALDAPSYFDYSMRRHSLSNNINGSASPDRHLHQQQHHEPPLPSPGLKRKTSGDAEEFQDGYLQAARYNGQPTPVGAPPNPKRRTSSLTYDKLNNLSLSDAARRESYHSIPPGPISPWEEDRRGSGGSYASSVNSQTYPMQGYPNVASPYEQVPPHQQHHHQPGPPWDGQAVGPRGSISRGPYDEMAYQRRPSIPSVSQMMQGQTAYYPTSSTAPPLPSPHSHVHPLQPYPSHSRGLTQPTVMVSSVPHTPTEIMEDGHSRTASSASYSSIPPGSVPPGPAPWSRSGGQPVRQNSASSLDPASAYAPGQGPPAKDSPYSRSPELRVSHKLAERKRRKEMASLFDDLREALPFERGLKASKWEILSKATEYVADLKRFAYEVQQENRELREHYGLGPSAHSPPPMLTYADVYGQQPPPGSSHSSAAVQHTSSQEASPAPSTAPGGAAPPFQPTSAPPPQPGWPSSAPSPALSNASRPTTAQPHPSSQHSPHSATFPPQAQQHHPQQQQQHPQSAYSAPPPAPNGTAQHSPPLQYAGSQGGAASPQSQAGVQLDGSGSPTGLEQQQPQQQHPPTPQQPVRA
ncbi:hypothetical protein JCM8097_005053 [Rhodosporidiobolus ruineniae]